MSTPLSTRSPETGTARVPGKAVTLRSYLARLTLAALVPVAVFAIALALLLVDRERETFRRGAEERTLAILSAVESQLQSSVIALQALAFSSSLGRDDLGAFRDLCSRVLIAQSDWSTINLALPSGQQVLNLLRPPGTPLPMVPAEDGSIAFIKRTLQPVIGNLVVGPATRRWDYAVRVPVVRDGKLRYVLSAVIKTDSMARLLAAQDMPSNWIGVVVDANNRIVTRTLNGPRFIGEPASRSLRDALARTPYGWFRGTTIEGSDVYTAYRRSNVTGWSFAMAIPAAVVNQVESRARWTVALGLLAALAVALALASIVGRRVAGPISALAKATKAMGHGESVALPEDIRVAELQTLATALREAERGVRERQELIEREKEALRAADRAKDEFLAMLSHELRTPLAAMTTAAHVLRLSGPDGSTAVQARGVIERQTRQMARLIEDLLDISRVTMGKVSLKREALDLAEVVGNMISGWRSAGRFERHHVTFSGAQVWVDGDRARVEQIAANLLDNALKFTPPGKAIRIAVRREGEDALLQVSDEGIGIEPGSLEGVFELFVQGEFGLDRGKGGLGIGLALVKRLAEMHGGNVSARSEGAGRGAAFTVRLPALDRAPARAERAAAEPHVGPRRILVVEDNDDVRQMLRTALALSGHEVREAADGRTALAAAAQLHPHIALIDIGLPDIDGYELARRLRADRVNGHMALIALSGYGQPADLERALDAGFDVHLTKPVTAEALKSTIAGFH